jgi:hypothetical protein
MAKPAFALLSGKRRGRRPEPAGENKTALGMGSLYRNKINIFDTLFAFS